MKRTFFALIVVALALGIVPIAFAGGPTDKVTGSGTWVNTIGHTYYAEFNAHEPTDTKDAKGMLVQAYVSGGSDSMSGSYFMVAVDAVFVEDTHACFGGIITEAAGVFFDRGDVGKYRWTAVVDGGEGIGAMDYLRGNLGSSGSAPLWCLAGDVAGNEAFSGGNVQIHKYVSRR